LKDSDSLNKKIAHKILETPMINTQNLNPEMNIREESISITKELFREIDDLDSINEDDYRPASELKPEEANDSLSTGNLSQKNVMYWYCIPTFKNDTSESIDFSFQSIKDTDPPVLLRDEEAKETWIIASIEKNIHTS